MISGIIADTEYGVIYDQSYNTSLLGFSFVLVVSLALDWTPLVKHFSLKR